MAKRARKNTAKLSRCRHYRYALWRTWENEKPTVLFIGLNPSTADETNDDPTLRRCINFAKSWGYGGVCMANLFAYRATDPVAIRECAKPIGPQNNRWLKQLAAEADLVIAAWGNDGSLYQRSRYVCAMLPKMKYLKMNKTGEPAHPLYLTASLRPKAMSVRK